MESDAAPENGPDPVEPAVAVSLLHLYPVWAGVCDYLIRTGQHATLFNCLLLNKDLARTAVAHLYRSAVPERGCFVSGIDDGAVDTKCVTLWWAVIRKSMKPGGLTGFPYYSYVRYWDSPSHNFSFVREGAHKSIFIKDAYAATSWRNDITRIGRRAGAVGYPLDSCRPMDIRSLAFSGWAIHPFDGISNLPNGLQSVLIEEHRIEKHYVETDPSIVSKNAALLETCAGIRSLRIRVFNINRTIEWLRHVPEGQLHHLEVSYHPGTQRNESPELETQFFWALNRQTNLKSLLITFQRDGHFACRLFSQVASLELLSVTFEDRHKWPFAEAYEDQDRYQILLSECQDWFASLPASCELRIHCRADWDFSWLWPAVQRRRAVYHIDRLELCVGDAGGPFQYWHWDWAHFPGETRIRKVSIRDSVWGLARAAGYDRHLQPRKRFEMINTLTCLPGLRTLDLVGGTDVADLSQLSRCSVELERLQVQVEPIDDYGRVWRALLELPKLAELRVNFGFNSEARGGLWPVTGVTPEIPGSMTRIRPLDDIARGLLDFLRARHEMAHAAETQTPELKYFTLQCLDRRHYLDSRFSFAPGTLQRATERRRMREECTRIHELYSAGWDANYCDCWTWDNPFFQEVRRYCGKFRLIHIVDSKRY